MTTRRPLERYVEPEITDARIARQWAGTEQRMARMRRAWWRLPALGAAVVASVALVILLAQAHRPDRVTEGALLESTGPQAITLDDGSRVDLAPRSRVRVGALESNRFELSLEQGAAAFDVRHIPGRRFVVHVGSFDIVDVGTRFTLALTEAGAITVSVEQGAVRIERKDSSEPTRFLSAGEHWSTNASEGDGSAAPAERDASVAEPPPSVGPTATVPGAASISTAPPTLTPPPPSSKDLLESAQRAQRAGRLREAATAYDRLRREYRGDGRAGLAAFELGRLRLGPLGDPRGAAQAFQDAIVLSPNATFREDAEAHLVEAFDRAGDAVRCGAARSAYLAQYPQGLHAGSVSSRCASTP
jgi:hypothetical protein